MAAGRYSRGLFGSAPVRLVSRAIIWIGFQLGRIASYSRARVLFPDCPDVVCHWTTEVKCPENVTLGQRVVICTNCTTATKAPIYIGDDVMMSKGVFVDTGTADNSTPPPYEKMSKAIRIEKGVWLGAYSMVMAG